MKIMKSLPNHFVATCLVMSLALLGCAEQDEPTTTNTSSTTTPTTTETTTETTTPTTTETTTETTTSTGPSDPSIGNPVGDSIAIDHATAHQTMVDNLTAHIDGLDTSLGFLEDSRALTNISDFLFGDDDEERDEGEKSKKKEEPWEVDFSDFRDGVVEFFSDRLMVEETATLAEDGLSITYAVSAEYFCAEEPRKDASAEDEKERLEDEAECAERLATNPFQLFVTSDAVGDLNISFQVGAEATEAFNLQLHDDQISFHLYLEPFDRLLANLVRPEDFELPTTRSGSLGVELRQDATSIYTVRFAILEDLSMEAEEGQETVEVTLGQAENPGSITIDGEATTLDGYLELGVIYGALPWQWIVDTFYDDEGYSEWNEELGYDEWIDPTEPPEVDETVSLDLPGVTGTLAYSAADDVFRLTGMGLGDASTLIMVDGVQITSLDINEDNGRVMDLALTSPADLDLGFIFSSDFEIKANFAWHQVKGVFEDLPEFLMDETLGVRMDGSAAPELQILDIEEDTQVQMSSGRLTLFSSAMLDDIVIEEGECITSIDEDTLTDEEIEAQHDLFGGLIGATCE